MRTVPARELRTHSGPRPDRDRGFAFVLALVAAVMIAGIATTLAVVSYTEVRVSDNYLVAKQATYLAEAGIQHALWQLSADPALTAPLVNKGLGASKYDVIINRLDDHQYDILSWGRTPTAFGAGMSVRASVFPQSLNYVVATKDFLDYTSAAQVEGSITVTTAREMDVDWAALAAAADVVLSGNQSYTDLSWEGFVYVRGDIWFHGTTSIRGTVVSEHDIRIDPGGSRTALFQAGPGMPALVAANDIIIGEDWASATITVNGFVYSDHKIKARAYNRLLATGVLACKDNFEIQWGCPEVRLSWDPEIRNNPPMGISQHDAALRHSWAFLPGTWQNLADRSAFE